MGRVVVTAAARADLLDLIRTHSLPPDTESRLARALHSLSTFPRLGSELGGGFAGRRFILGPWRWMVVVYRLYEDRNLVAVLAIVDGRSAGSPTGQRREPPRRGWLRASSSASSTGRPAACFLVRKVPPALEGRAKLLARAHQGDRLLEVRAYALARVAACSVWAC